MIKFQHDKGLEKNVQIKTSKYNDNMLLVGEINVETADFENSESSIDDSKFIFSIDDIIETIETIGNIAKSYKSKIRKPVTDLFAYHKDVAQYFLTDWIHPYEAIGKRGKLETFYKIRTMKFDWESDNNTPDYDELDALGKPQDHHRVIESRAWMRKSHVDELPGIIGLLTFKMSLVGGRPLIQKVFDQAPKKLQQQYFEFGPGLGDPTYTKKIETTEENWQLKQKYYDARKFYKNKGITINILSRPILDAKYVAKIAYGRLFSDVKTK